MFFDDSLTKRFQVCRYSLRERRVGIVKRSATLNLALRNRRSQLSRDFRSDVGLNFGPNVHTVVCTICFGILKQVDKNQPT